MAQSRAVNGHCGKPADGSANETTSARAACVRAGCDNRAMQDDIPCPPIYQRRHSNGYARSKADRVRANASVRAVHPSSETAQGLLFMQVNDFLTDHLEGWHSAACVPKKPLIFHSSFAESREWWITRRLL